MEDHKIMCWYDQECIESMNRFYDKEIKGHDLTSHGHLNGFTNLLALVEPKDTPLLDLGTGTGMISEFCKDFQFVGSDLPHILTGSAMRNYPEYLYKACDIVEDNLDWIEKFPVVVVNGVIDIMPSALSILQKVLQHTRGYLLIHRQEITEQGVTHEVGRPSYNSNTWHSIINRADFNELVDRMNFDIVKEEMLCFSNWENNGSSFLLKRRRSYSLFNIDHKLFTKYFSKHRNGAFLEVGANDGERQSNTLYLEERNNWSGILIEPVREIWKECKAKRSAKNICVNAALVSSEYKKDTIEINHVPSTSGLMSFISTSDEDYAEQVRKLRDAPVYTIEVLARTLDNILEAIWNEAYVIDLASIDVEGYEREVLKGIDFNRWQIRYLLVEQRNGDEGILDLIGDHFEFVEKITPQDYLYKARQPFL